MNFNFKTVNTKYLPAVVLCLCFLLFVSCQRDDDSAEDDLPQEEITNIILNVKNLSTGENISYNYSMGAGSAKAIKLEDGISYEVETRFINGEEDVTEEIREAKDEHFMIFDFPRSEITLSRQDPPESTGIYGKVGLLTRWQVQKAEVVPDPLVIIKLIHDPAAASEMQNGSAWGSVTGGETDAEAIFSLTN